LTILRNRELNISSNLSESEKQLGIDLQLNGDFDLQLNNLEDFEAVASYDNVAQALSIKLQTEPGENRYAPQIGISLPIGTKTTNALDLKLQIIRSLGQDPRLSDIDAFVQISGNIYFINIKAKILNRDINVPLQFAIEN
jgi:hypothetical protein